MVIGIAGCMMAGKSSLADHLIKTAAYHGLVARRTPFAGPLRDEVYDMVCRRRLMPICGPQESYRWVMDNVFSVGDLYVKPTPEHVRKVLCFHGTDFRRKQYSRYWVKLFNDHYGPLVHDNGIILIADDVRFYNEVEYIQGNGGKVIWLERTVEGQDRGHSSENSLRPEDCDIVLNSNVVLEDMLASGEEWFACQYLSVGCT